MLFAAVVQYIGIQQALQAHLAQSIVESGFLNQLKTLPVRLAPR